MIRVLLADDAEDLRFLVRVTLEDDGRFEVVGDATTGKETMELLERETPDVLVLDMAMPEMDGLEVLTEMKNRGLRSKVLILSGFDGVVEEKASALGAHDYIRKGSTTLDELVPRILALVAL